MSCIFENLYIGDLNDACNEILKKKLNISHILTIEHRPLSLHMIHGATYHYVHLLDTADSDLLSHLPTCMEFIQQGRAKGVVMVHCHAGQSRSGAVVVAFLMKQLRFSCEEALTFARKMKADICPNEGFMSQLELYGRMDCELLQDDPDYRTFKLHILSTNIQNAQNRTQLIEKYLDQSTNPPLNQALYKCKKCRHTLFGLDSVLTHAQEGNKAINFKNKYKNHSKNSLKTNQLGLKTSQFVSNNTPNDLTHIQSEVCKYALFIEPVSWMKDCILELSGKFLCPKCSSKMGSWDWTGQQCSCGKWVTPCFQIISSKVDLVTAPPQATVPSDTRPTRTNYVFRD